MESETFTKKYNFRLPDITIERLDEIVKNGKARNRTEAIIRAVDSYSQADKIDQLIDAMGERTTALVQLVERAEKFEYLQKLRQDPDKKQVKEKTEEKTEHK